MRKLKFWVVSAGERVSTCGRYRIWIQERPLHERAWWMAARIEPDRNDVWLMNSASTFRDAVDACNDDLAQRAAASKA